MPPSRKSSTRSGQTVLVIDASICVVALSDDSQAGDRARRRLRDENLAAPELIDLEVASVLRKLVSTGLVPARRADLALADLISLPMDRARHQPLLPRVWQLRGNVSAYDAAYVALAEAIDVPLLTADTRLAAAPGPRCVIELLEP
jgi:predicted nucleic acid-binding protein